jgi:excisionase family DNA binding protein
MIKLPEKELLRPDEVAAYFSVSIRTVYRWVDEGKFKTSKPSYKVLRIFRKSVLNLLESTTIDDDKRQRHIDTMRIL